MFSNPNQRTSCRRQSGNGLRSGIFNRYRFHPLAPTAKSAYAYFVNASDLITIDPGILGGTPVFRGTRVPVQTLFQYLESNYTMDEFLECFPTVTREAAIALLDQSEVALLATTR